MLKSAVYASFLIFPALPAAAEDMHVLRTWDPVGTAVLAVADLDGDGLDELIVGSRTTREVHVLKHSTAPRGYDTLFRITGADMGESDSRYSFVGLLDVDNDGREELVIVWSHTKIQIIEPATGSTLSSATIPASSGLAIGDVDGDGIREILTTWGSTLHVLDPVSLQVKGYVFTPHVADGLLLSDVLGDSRDEVILDSGVALTLSRTGSEYSVESIHAFSDTPVTLLAASDVDNDGYPDLVTKSQYAGLFVHHFRPSYGQTAVLETDDLRSVVLRDLDDSGDLEAVVAFGSGETRAIDLGSGATLWSDLRGHARGALSGVARLSTAGDAVLYAAEESLWAETLAPESHVLMRTPPSSLNPAAVALLNRPGQQNRLAVLSPSLSGGAVDFWAAPDLRSSGGTPVGWIEDPMNWANRYEQNDIVQTPVGSTSEAFAVVGAKVVGGTDPQPRIWFASDQGLLTRTLEINGDFTLTSAITAQILPSSSPQIVASARSDADGTDSLVIVDSHSGNILWRSLPVVMEHARLPHFRVADLNSDSQLDIAFHAGDDVRIYSPSLGTSPVKTYGSVLNMTTWAKPGSGEQSDLILHRTGGALQRIGDLSDSVLSSIQVNEPSSSITAFSQVPAVVPWVAVRKTYSLDVYAFESPTPILSKAVSGNGLTVEAMDLEGDNQTELVFAEIDLTVLRVPNDYILDAGFEPALP